MAEGIILILGLILLAIGILLAFFGRSMWEAMMSLIGGFIGWFLGFGITIYFLGSDGWYIGIIVGFLCGFVGSILFHYLVEVALALIAGVLAGGLVYIIGGAGWAIPAIIVFAVVFAISYYYIDDLIGVITALIGGILSAVAVFIILMEDTGGIGEGATITSDPVMAILAGVLIFVFGALVQTYVLDG